MDAPATAKKSFGALLRAMREAASLSQEELAERAKLTTHAISALERGARTRPYPHTIRSLADALEATDTERAALVQAVPSRRRESARPTDASESSTRVRRLPVPPTALVARDVEVAEVAALVRDPARRIVTLTGMGGVGKTRLSIAVATAVSDSFPDGVIFVELAPLLDANLVLSAVADGIGVARAEGGDTETVIADELAGLQVLLVLDNFEHLLAAAPPVARLVESCPGLTVLTSSRAALRVRGETEVVVPPLAVPDAEPDLEALAASPAGALFLDRARAVSPDLELTGVDTSAIAAICTRLAGIPLALELAAARTRFLDPPTLLARLDDAIAGDGARDLPARQRTMTAALDWSYGLLDREEQALLRLVSFFTGGFTLEDAEAVAGRAGTVPAGDVLRLLESLVEQSLVVAAGRGGSRRHHLLEPVVQYGRRMLDQAGETDAVAAGHTAHFVDLAEQAAPEYQRADQVRWLARIDAEHANMSAAMERALTTGNAGDAARIGWALWLYWWLRGHLLHGRRLMEATLTHPLPDPLRAQAEIAAATMAFAQDDIEASGAWWQSARERATGSGDPLTRVNSTAGVGLARLAAGDLAGAEELFRESLPLAEAAGEEGDWIGSLVHVWLGTVTLLGGDPDRARGFIEQGLISAERRGDRLTMYIALYNLSQVAASCGDRAQARQHLVRGLRLSTETRDLANLAYLLDALAVVEAADGAHPRVPVLLGAAQGIREVIGTTGYGYYRPDEELGRQAAEQAREALGEDAFDDALDVGRAMTVEDAVSFGLGSAG